VTGGRGAAAADDLQLARRVDWRFLLPRPDLGNVACSDRADPDLVAACNRFAASVSHLGGPGEERNGPAAGLDVVVLVDPVRAEIAQAAARLRAGGWLYAELPRRLRPTPGASRRRCLRLLRTRGFEEIAVHVHWPSFAECAEIFSPHDPAPARAWIARRREHGGHRALGVLILRLALRLGLLADVAPVSVVARAPVSR
jgi:hypothetical protein